jgi:hypothetical protein
VSSDDWVNFDFDENDVKLGVSENLLAVEEPPLFLRGKWVAAALHGFVNTDKWALSPLFTMILDHIALPYPNLRIIIADPNAELQPRCKNEPRVPQFCEYNQ